jgi:hypothetical protein
MQETIIRDRNAEGYTGNLVGVGSVASGLTLVATFHPFLGFLVSAGGAITLLLTNVPFLKRLFPGRRARD